MADLRLGSLFVEEHGDAGETIVMLHGLGGSSNSFETLMPALGGYRVLRIDLPGAGRSAPRPGMPGMAGLIRAVEDALRLARIERAHCVAHSMGTLVAEHLAATRPQLVASLVLFGALLEPPVAARAALRARARDARLHGMADIASAVASGSVSAHSRATQPAVTAFVRESLMRQPAHGYAAHCEALAAAQAAAHDAITCPTLLVAGEDDPVAPVAMARELATRVAHARLEVLPRVGHWMMLEAAPACLTLLTEHLDSNCEAKPRDEE